MSYSTLQRAIYSALLRSSLYRDYEKAFTQATGLPLRLQPVGACHLAHHGRANENPFCELIANAGPACAACMEMQADLESNGGHTSRSGICPAGLCDTAVPVLVNGETVAFLHTGQVFRRTPTETDFEKAVLRFKRWKIRLDTVEFRKAFFGSQVIPAKRHAAIIQLLGLFAEQLSQAGVGICLEINEAEPAFVQAAKRWVEAHSAGDCSLALVAHAVHMNAFTFCRQFRQATDMHFSEFLGQTRVLQAQKQLQRPQARVNEVALEAGFRSLPHFNRVFKKMTGQSPSEYRHSLPATTQAL